MQSLEGILLTPSPRSSLLVPSSAEAQGVFPGGKNPLNNLSAGAGLRGGQTHSTLRLHSPRTAAF